MAAKHKLVQILFGLVVLSCSLLALCAPKLQAETLHLTSLHWPPYASQYIPSQGASVQVVKAALNAMGHDLAVDFYPWSRAVKLASQQNQYLGYFPEYYYETDKFLFSDAMGTSPLGLVEPALHPISWVDVADLNNYTLGVVQDYVNTIELDAMIASGKQTVEAVMSDENNLKKVAAARIDAAVMDVYVMHYLLAQKAMQPFADRVQINRKLLANKHLFIAFQNTPEGRKWRDIFNQGLAKIDVAAILASNLPVMSADTDSSRP